MGLLDGLVSGVIKGVISQAEQQALPAILSQLLGKTDIGSVGGLLGKLQKAGLGGQVSSWLGNGANLPISADQLRNALGNGQLRQMAEHAGLPVDQILDLLAQKLPQTVDAMSPNGQLKEPDAASGDLAGQAGLSDIR